VVALERAEAAIGAAVGSETAHGHLAVQRSTIVLVDETGREAELHGRRAHAHAHPSTPLAGPDGGGGGGGGDDDDLPDVPLHAYAGPLPLRPDKIVNPRVAVILTLWDRLVDREELHRALDLLTAQEMQEAVHRLGWLHLFNPRVADRPYFFDLAHADHRAMAFMLIELQDKESGELWGDQIFQWGRAQPPIEGFKLRGMRGKWQMEAELMEHRGLLNFNYVSTRSGNAPNDKAREKMAAQMVCANEIEVPLVAARRASTNNNARAKKKKK